MIEFFNTHPVISGYTLPTLSQSLILLGFSLKLRGVSKAFPPRDYVPYPYFIIGAVFILIGAFFHENTP